jgi:molybdopterin-containing oxidoreductase family iron-sulfur binding subunit
MRKYVMAIDLGKCKNARKCVEACQCAHHLPPDQELMKVYLMQESEETAPYWMPKPCFHCDHPLCAEACPEGATVKRPDGIVVIDYSLCKNCRLCMKVCPYSSRQFNRKTDPAVGSVTALSANTDHPVNKCDFCFDRVSSDKLPHCAEACPNGAIYFGDLIDNVVSNGNEELNFTELLNTRKGFRHLEDLGSGPSVYYLPPVTD